MFDRKVSHKSGAVLARIPVIISLVLAGALAVPTVVGSIASNEKAQVLGDLRRLSGDIASYYQDTGTWPATGTFAYTDGGAAYGEETCFGRLQDARSVTSFLATNKDRVANWNGPYVTVRRPDPWGRRYVIVLDRKKPGGSPRGWVLSAGPDGLFETGRDSTEVQGDDLGLLLH